MGNQQRAFPGGSSHALPMEGAPEPKTYLNGISYLKMLDLVLSKSGERLRELLYTNDMNMEKVNATITRELIQENCYA